MTSNCLEINAKYAPYHLIKTALNVPARRFGNRRGRNADFFVFSQGYIGSEATGYVETKSAEAIVDGLNIGTAMAITVQPQRRTWGWLDTALLADDRAVECPARPVDPAPARYRPSQSNAEGERKKRTGRTAERRKANGRKARRGERQFWRIPRPRHLLYEAFSKTGVSVEQLDAKAMRKRHGFVFLTDGGHIDNLGVYELLRRRCKLIIAIDGEADPDFDFGIPGPGRALRAN